MDKRTKTLSMYFSHDEKHLAINGDVLFLSDW